MKKLFWIALLTTVFVFQTSFVFSQEEATTSATVSPTPTPVPYVLPYPGLLPDHPLWFVKAARDRIIAFLISDPLKKSEFAIKQADKRLAGGEVLFKKSKPDLAISTISKGENYLEEGARNLSEAKKTGKDIKDLLNTLMRSSRKHQEVLMEIERTISQDKKESLSKERMRVEKVIKQGEELK